MVMVVILMPMKPASIEVEAPMMKETVVNGKAAPSTLSTAKKITIAKTTQKMVR